MLFQLEYNFEPMHPEKTFKTTRRVLEGQSLTTTNNVSLFLKIQCDLYYFYTLISLGIWFQDLVKASWDSIFPRMFKGEYNKSRNKYKKRCWRNPGRFRFEIIEVGWGTWVSRRWLSSACALIGKLAFKIMFCFWFLFFWGKKIGKALFIINLELEHPNLFQLVTGSSPLFAFCQ